MDGGDTSPHSLRILCVDDNIHVTAMLKETLRAQGYSVATAVDGQQALNSIAKEPSSFDLIIADFRMPRLDGYQLARGARAAGYRGKTIIFASPLAQIDKERLRKVPVDAIFEKPARQSELLAKIKEVQDDLRTSS